MKEFLEYASTNGLALLISVLFIYICYRIVQLIFDSPKLLGKFAKKKHSQEHREAQQHREKVNQIVYTSIKEFIENHDGSRCLIIEFSNTVQSVVYMPFRYMTATLEAHTYDVPSAASRIQKIPTSLLTPFLMMLDEVPHLIMTKDNSAYKVCGAMQDLFNSIGDPQVCFKMLRSYKGTNFGIAVFCKPDGFNDEDLVEFDALGNSISGYLGARDI